MWGIGIPGAHPSKNTPLAVPTKMILGELLMRPLVFIFTYNDQAHLPLWSRTNLSRLSISDVLFISSSNISLETKVKILRLHKEIIIFMASDSIWIAGHLHLSFLFMVFIIDSLLKNSDAHIIFNQPVP